MGLLRYDGCKFMLTKFLVGSFFKSTELLFSSIISTDIEYPNKESNFKSLLTWSWRGFMLLHPGVSIYNPVSIAITQHFMTGFNINAAESNKEFLRHC